MIKVTEKYEGGTTKYFEVYSLYEIVDHFHGLEDGQVSMAGLKSIKIEFLEEGKEAEDENSDS